jgi:hypothetical protein
MVAGTTFRMRSEHSPTLQAVRTDANRFIHRYESYFARFHNIFRFNENLPKASVHYVAGNHDVG